MFAARITKIVHVDSIRSWTIRTPSSIAGMPSTATSTGNYSANTADDVYGSQSFNKTARCWLSSIGGSDSITVRNNDASFAIRMFYYYSNLVCTVRSYLLVLQYSGGQASVGQGGFYGSGGARALSPDHTSTTTDNVFDQQNKERSKMLAMAQDVQTVRLTMQELDLLESLLRNEEESNASKNSTSDGKVSSKSMEIKNSIKKLMTSTDFLESLNNLEVQGEPAWGLNCEEREMIILAREKVNAC